LAGAYVSATRQALREAAQDQHQAERGTETAPAATSA